MEIVRDVKEFVDKNESQLQKFFIYKTGIKDKELIREHLQDFYVKMIQTRALESYSVDKGSFDTYISTLLCWLLPARAKKNVSVQYKFVSSVKKKDQCFREEDEVWDHIGNFEGPFKVDFSPCTPRILDDPDEKLFIQYLDDFKEYIKRTESAKSSDSMLIFLQRKQEGCNSSEIAIALGVSDNMVKIYKQRLRRKFEIWQTLS